MSLTNKLKTGILIAAGAVAIGGCHFFIGPKPHPSGSYQESYRMIAEDNKHIHALDRNKDNKWDTLVITTRPYPPVTRLDYCAKDTDFNGSWDRLSYTCNIAFEKPFLNSHYLFLDEDNDGIYEKGELDALLNEERHCITFMDSNKDGEFDRCKYKNSTRKMSQEKHNELLKNFNKQAKALKENIKKDLEQIRNYKK